jgi:hypothetical protein
MGRFSQEARELFGERFVDGFQHLQRQVGVMISNIHYTSLSEMEGRKVGSSLTIYQ